MNEPYMTYAVAAIALVGGWIAFKIFKKILVALLVIGLLMLIGLAVLFKVVF